MTRNTRRTDDRSPLSWLHANKRDLAPLTGQDTRALLAIAACWELYFAGDDAGQAAALGAVRQLLRGMQPKCWSLAKALIPWAGDWPHEEPTWSQLVEGDEQLVTHFFNAGGAA